MRKALLFTLLFSSLSLFSQTLDFYSMPPLWKLGDKKTVSTKSYSQISLNDSIISQTSLNGSYEITVIDTVDAFTLRYKQNDNNITSPKTENVTLEESVMLGITEDLLHAFNNLSYDVLVEKTTGLAYEIKNTEALLETITQSSTRIITDNLKSTPMSSYEIDSVKKVLTNHYANLLPEMEVSILNSINYLLQSYSYNFPFDNVAEQAVSTYELNQLGDFKGVEFPAIMSIGAKQEEENTTSIKIEMDYDIPYFIEQLKKTRSSTEIRPEEITLINKSKIDFNSTTTWIKEHQTFMKFTIKDVVSIEKTIITVN